MRNKKVRLLILLLVIAATGRVFLTSTLSKINYDVEKQKREIAEQQKTNESLTMAINELASLTKIEEVAKAQGLSYNNSNIKSVVESN